MDAHEMVNIWNENEISYVTAHQRTMRAACSLPERSRGAMVLWTLSFGEQSDVWSAGTRIWPCRISVIVPWSLY